jgi:toxin ParE1/3/4
MKIIWTHESLERLIDIEDFISKDSPERAITFVDQIIDHTEKVLSGKPLIGRIVPEIGNLMIRRLT